MNDDIRPVRPSTGSSGVFQTNAQANPPLARPSLPAPVETVDEDKIEEEFGPPPDEMHRAEPKKPFGKLPKLLQPGVRHRLSRKQLIAACGVVVLLLGAGGASSYLVFKQRHQATVKPVEQTTKKVAPPAPPVPTTVASTLTGLPVDPSVNSRPVTAVMIENSIDARPQSGLDQAGVVFEALAEGGVTRFMALFQDSQPDYIGPVRSARPYYIQWLLGFDAAYAHVGGSPDALQDITSWGVKDLNQFYNSGAYERISSRYAPHNVYTSIAQLNQVETAKGYTTSSYTGFTRKQEAPSKAPTASSIDLTFSGYYYNAHFSYDPTTNTYKRSESGQPHMELHKDGTTVQIAPKVVVAMIVPEHAGALDSSGAYYSDYQVIGSGALLVFQDGLVTSGTWTKTSNTAQLNFTDSQGHALALNPGQVWISAMPTASDVIYK